MYCPQCGLNNKDGETVCSSCGTPLPTTPPRKQNVFVRFLKAVLMCVIKKYQLRSLKTVISQVDPSAFVIFTDAREVLGKGFE